MVTPDAYKALFRCNHLRGIAMMPIASCIPFPFFAPCNDMLAMLFCATHWLYVHLYTRLHVHAWVLLVSVSSMLQHNEAMDIRSKPTFVPHKHHLLFAILLVYPLLVVCYLACLPLCSYVCLHMLCLSLLSCLFVLHLFVIIYASFPFHCSSASFLSLLLHVHTWTKDTWS